MADNRQWERLISDAMDRHAVGRVHIDDTDQLIEESRRAVLSSRELLERTRRTRFANLVAR
jgi:hypothetical protein